VVNYRLLAIDEAGNYYTYSENSSGTNATPIVNPNFRGRVPAGVPFTVINARDLSLSPGDVPLLGVSDANVAIYRSDADYRQSLHMLAQETLVITGVNEYEQEDVPMRIGAGARIMLPEGADAKFVGLQGVGLAEQRLAMLDDYRRAYSEGAKLLENDSSAAESGEALKARVHAKTTTLNDVAKTAAAGLERALRQCAVWVGANPDEVQVFPNTDFVEDVASGQDLRELLQARELGAPISLQTIHEYMQRNEFVDLSWEEEMTRIESEGDLLESLRPTPPAAPESPDATPADEEDAEETTEE